MFNDVGENIKVLAKIQFALFSLGAIILGCIINTQNPSSQELGWALIIGGPIISLISAWVLYGFGEIVCKIGNIEDEVVEIKRKLNAQNRNLGTYKGNKISKKLRNQKEESVEEFFEDDQEETIESKTYPDDKNDRENQDGSSDVYKVVKDEKYEKLISEAFLQYSSGKISEEEFRKFLEDK